MKIYTALEGFDLTLSSKGFRFDLGGGPQNPPNKLTYKPTIYLFTYLKDLPKYLAEAPNSSSILSS